ncbi:MAG TPA: zinc ribbon domain-containing protein [Rhodospirillaceae bacterium]|nr:zinc ribbon domain-containing protein [Rhodospirillaceae bacterium]
MPEMVRYRCLNCGHRFEEETLSPEESRERRKEGKRTWAIHCPECNRTDIRPGWE